MSDEDLATELRELQARLRSPYDDYMAALAESGTIHARIEEIFKLQAAMTGAKARSTAAPARHGNALNLLEFP